MKTSVESVVDKVSTLISMPDIYYKVDRAVDDPTISLDQIGSLILEDQGLASRVLMLANSAFYSYPSHVTTITKALTIIGTKQVRELLMATLIMKQFNGVPKDYLDLESFWKHSIGTGVAARTLAGYMLMQNIESYYVSGLVHDIGRLVLLLVMPDKFVEVMQYSRNREILLTKAEEEVLGFNHCDIGRELFIRWKLPASIQTTTGKHHRPGSVSSYNLETSVIHIADIIATCMRLGSSGETFVQRIDYPSWNQLKLNDKVIPEIVQQIEEQYKNSLSIFLEV